MRSITTRLTVSLVFAAVVIFLTALSIVVWLDKLHDPEMAPCQAATEILTEDLLVASDQRLGIKTTTEVERLQSTSPNLWYLVSFKGTMTEFGRERRPALPFSLPYNGPKGRSLIMAADQSRAFCLDVLARDGADLVVMVGGANIDGRQLAKTFVLRNLSSLLLVAFGFALIVALGTFLSARFVARSIERVTRLALAIEPTAPQASIPLAEVPIELQPLVSALNGAFGEIDAYIQSQRRFLGNAAHQLRTPLTLLRAKIEEVAPPALKAELVRDVRRLTSLVSAMLDLARLQNHAVEKHPVDLVALTRDVLADFSPSALDAGIELSLEQTAAGPVIVQGVEVAIRSALSNLVGNALVHAQGAQRVVASLAPGSVSIGDDGIGMPPGSEPRRIEPFQTGDARAGAGLGLSIVQEIMAAHDGTLTVTSNEGRGTLACLRFPLARASLRG